MNHTDDNHRYRPYYRHYNRRYDDDDYKQQYKKSNRQYYQYPTTTTTTTARRDHRNYHDSSSYRRSYKNDYHYQSSKQKSYSYFSSPPRPLMSTPVVPPPPPLLPPPPPPPPPPAPVNIVPHERESWVRSVKRTKINESDEQKTQYLETMLRMPQQKASLNASKFDRMRFSDSHPSATSTTNNLSNEHLHESSFQLIDDVHSNEDIRTLEKILFDNDIQQQTQSLPTPPQSVNESEPIVPPICSGFLIDNCDDEEELPPDSSPPRPYLPPLSEDVVKSHEENINEERVMLVSELNAADAERKQELKRQKHLQKKLKKTKSNQITRDEQQSDESPSDWIIEYDINQVSKLTDEIRRTSVTITNEDKTEKVNLILMKIKKQQEELRKLRQYVVSMLDEQDRPQLSNSKRTNSHLTHDLLLSLFNQTTTTSATTTGCWLCSGKTYSEIGIQCESDDESDKQ